ncbi:MAG: hypothetical protein GKR91_11010 [Pseudomonadales bacterium]|nr:hypothetical protein [Pseudomonadales bacterium]
MLAQFVDVSNWSAEQWLAACILAFIVVTALVVLHRSVKIFQLAKKSKYEPNLRPLRRVRSNLKSTVAEEDVE